MSVTDERAADVKETVQSFGPSRRLVGVLARPDAGAARAGGVAVVILNAGIIHRTGPNRLHVRIARRLASRGMPTLRFDLPGIGDSPTLGTPGSAIEEAVVGIGAALDELERLDVASRFVVFGLCSGADLAFLTASLDPRVVGTVLIDPNRIFPTWKSRLIRMVRPALRPVVWFRALTGRYDLFQKLSEHFRPDGRGEDGATTEEAPPPPGVPSDAEVRAQVRAALGDFVERDVRILYIVTRHYRSEYVYRRQFHDAFPDIDLGDRVTVEIMHTAHHTFTRESSRELLERTVDEWMGATFGQVHSDTSGSAAV